MKTLFPVLHSQCYIKSAQLFKIISQAYASSDKGHSGIDYYTIVILYTTKNNFSDGHFSYIVHVLTWRA